MGLRSWNISFAVLVLIMGGDTRSCRLVANHCSQETSQVWAAVGFIILLCLCSYSLFVLYKGRWRFNISGGNRIIQPLPRELMIGGLLHIDGVPVITDYNYRSRSNSLDSNTDDEADDASADRAGRRQIARRPNFWGISHHEITPIVYEVYDERLAGREDLGPDATEDAENLEDELTSQFDQLWSNLTRDLCEMGPRARLTDNNDVVYAYTGREERYRTRFWKGPKEPTLVDLRNIINAQFDHAEEEAARLTRLSRWIRREKYIKDYFGDICLFLVILLVEIFTYYMLRRVYFLW